jgi:urea transport system substrate-binding protein
LEESPNVVYLGGTPNQTILPLVRWAYSEKRRRRFFLLGSEYVYSYAVNAILEHELEDLGATIAGTHYALLGETRFDKIARRIKEHKEEHKDDKDMILCSIDGQSNVAFFHALRAAGITPKIVPTVWFNISESELSLFRISGMVGDYSVGCYFATLPRPENRAFLERFQKRYGAEARVNDAMQTAYFGVYLWKKAVEKAQSTDFAPVREALRNLTVDAPEGPIRIDARTQHAYRTARVGQVEILDGQAQFNIVYASPGPRAPEPYPGWKTPTEWKQFLDALYKGWGNHWEKHR